MTKSRLGCSIARKKARRPCRGFRFERRGQSEQTLLRPESPMPNLDYTNFSLYKSRLLLGLRVSRPKVEGECPMTVTQGGNRIGALASRQTGKKFFKRRSLLLSSLGDKTQ